MILPVKSIQSNQNLSIRAVAKLYDVRRETLRDRVAGRPARRDTPANQSSEPVFLVDTAINEPNVKIQRAISKWLALVRNTKAKYGILDDDTCNFDETGFMMGIIFAGMV